ncbi:MAG: hypothetical protein SGBAC_006435 [Bacillariaceae sp.]
MHSRISVALLGLVSLSGVSSFWQTPLSCNIRRYSLIVLEAASFDNNAVTDEDALVALERLEELDAKLGVGCGASKERTKLNAILQNWEESENQTHRMSSDAVGEYQKADDLAVDEGSNSYWDSLRFVMKHSSKEQVAVFGGDPARRRQAVEKKLAPYESLDQFGTPRDVGESDTTNLLRKIKRGKYDVVYLWTRFNCHNSRSAIREACLQTGTRFEEVNSLEYIKVRMAEQESGDG